MRKLAFVIALLCLAALPWKSKRGVQGKAPAAASYASTLAFEFNGVDERIDLGNVQTADGASRLIVSFWIRWVSGSQGWVIARRDTSQRQFGVLVLSTGLIRFYAASNLTTDAYVQSATSLTAGTWVHVICDLGDPSNPTDNASIAINGVDEGAMAGTLAAATTLPTPSVATSLYMADAALSDPIAMRLAHPAIWVGANAETVDKAEVYASASDPSDAPDLTALATTPTPDHWWPADSADLTTGGGVVDLGTGGANGTAENMDATDIVVITGSVLDAGVADSGIHPDATIPDSGVHPDAAVPDSGVDAGTALSAYATYLDSDTGETTVRDVAFDSSNNLVAAGGTAAAGLTDRGSGYQATGTFAGVHDVWVGKWSPDGTTQWLVMLGGAGYDRAYAVEVGSDGSVYVAGRAGAGFPTTSGVAQQTFAGDNNPNPAYGTQDGFVCKLSGTDGSVTWCTYVGDAAYAFVRDIALDSSDRVLVAVSQVSDTFAHVTVGAYDTSLAGVDAAIVRLSSDGTTIDWGTYLGGAGDDGHNPTVRVTANEVLVTSHGEGTAYPTTAGAFITAAEAAASCTDINVSVTSLSTDGSTNNWSTYLCGANAQGNETHVLEVTGDFVYVTLGTSDPILNLAPYTLLGWGPAPNTSNHALVRLDRATGAMEAATYYGATGANGPEGMALDSTGRVYTGGNADQTAPISSYVGALSGSNRSGLFLTWSADLTALEYAALIGTAGTKDEIRALAASGDGRMAFAGLAMADGWPGAAGDQSADGGVDRSAVPGWYTVAELDGGVPPVGDSGVVDTGPDAGVWPDASVDAGSLAYSEDMEGAGCPTWGGTTGTNNLDCDSTATVLEGSESAERTASADDLYVQYYGNWGLTSEVFLGVRWQTGAGSSTNYATIYLHSRSGSGSGSVDYTDSPVQVRIDNAGEIEVRCWDTGFTNQQSHVYSSAFTPGTAFDLKLHYVISDGVSTATAEAFVDGVSLGSPGSCGTSVYTVHGYILGDYQSRVNTFDNIQITASESAPGWDY